MLVGILYESKEWSSYALGQKMEELNIPVKMIDMEQEDAIKEVSECQLLVNRVFASAQFRGHQKALKQIQEVIEYAKENNITMVNPGDAHFYEIDKSKSTNFLREKDIAVPTVYGVFYPHQMREFEYPCIIKPNCGGRTNYTYIIRSKEELLKNIPTMPSIEFIVQEYIEPQYGFLTRIEVIDEECKLILKRSVTENGLSAYHLGSVYDQYPDCKQSIKDTAIKAMQLLHIETGSMDIIENDNGYYIIDVNAVSNASQDNINDFKFDLMLETAKYVAKKYHILKETGQ